MLTAAAVILSTLAGTSPALSHAHHRLHDQCLLHAADPRNPWALAHGITGLGASFAAADGRLARKVIVEDFVQPGPVFQRFALDSTPIEPHVNLIAKTLVLSGVPLTTPFKTASGVVTLRQLVDKAKADFRTPQSHAQWAGAAWSLDLFSQVMKPGDTWLGADKKTISIDALMDEALKQLEDDTDELQKGLRQGLPQVDKRKQGIYAHPCGGMHFIQAVLGWARHPSVRKNWGQRVETQMAVLMYRLESERRQYDAAIQQAPALAVQILVQMMKFYGHFLETTARAKSDLKWVPTTLQRDTVSRAKALLDFAVRELETRKVFDSMETIKAKQPQLYLDLIGDACHAAHGLDGWR